MMSHINSLDATYKAQFSELSEMKKAVSEMKEAGRALGDTVDAASENTAIANQLQTFVTTYNEWVAEFEATVKGDGVLAGTQAAEISLYELRQSIENRFNGSVNQYFLCDRGRFGYGYVNREDRPRQPLLAGGAKLSLDEALRMRVTGTHTSGGDIHIELRPLYTAETK